MKLIRGIINVIRYLLIGSVIGLGIRTVIDMVKAEATTVDILKEVGINIILCLVVYGIAEIIIWIFGGSNDR